MDVTFDYYKAFLPELREHLTAYAAPAAPGTALNKLRIRPAIDATGRWVAVVIVDVTIPLPADDDEIPEVQGFTYDFTLAANGYSLFNSQARLSDLQMRTGRELLAIPGLVNTLHSKQPRWRRVIEAWVAEIPRVIRRRCAVAADAWKEEIVAKLWAPERVAALLEKGGWELVESL